ncbi:MAG: cell division protein FtsB [Burkholderiales bacterium]
MKLLAIMLAALLALIQYPLWLGRGGILRGVEMERQVRSQHVANEHLRGRNQALEAEVRDLKQGLEAIEERARSELGLIRQDEVFFQIIESAPAESPPR